MHMNPLEKTKRLARVKTVFFVVEIGFVAPGGSAGVDYSGQRTQYVQSLEHKALARVMNGSIHIH